MKSDGQFVWQTCSVNCGGHCALRFFVEDGRLDHVETDDLPDVEGAPQMRACLRGRALRYWLESPDRLNYPLRRVGERGSGRFERITWEEALHELTSQLTRIVQTWGNEAILVPYGTGLFPAEGSPFERLLNCYGGYLSVYRDYSSAQLQAAMEAMFGDDGYYSASTFSEAANADVVVLFGSSPNETRMGGAGAASELLRAREVTVAEKGRPFKLIAIDPRHTDVAAHEGDEWIAIRPGTDAALVAAMAYVLITENLIDRDFLNEYCVGFDEATLPPSAASGSSYESYVMGHGPDGIVKDPKWASALTGCPEATIQRLAREIGEAERVFVAQGWGPQRSEFGEQTARAICMLALMTGNFGLPGTNSGARERFLEFSVPADYVGSNPVEVSIPAFEWLRAVEEATAMTADGNGVRGAERLQVPVKMIVNHGGNCLTNQHADINRTHRILADDSLCEFIVTMDVMLTDSARYSDLILPDVARMEQSNLVSSGSADILRGLVRGQAWPHEGYERRSAFDVAREVAARLGVLEAFDALGKTQDETDAARLAQSQLETAYSLDELDVLGVVREPYEGSRIAYEAFRADPEGHPLPTPSGKVEIYSEALAELAEKTGRTISPLPIYIPAREGWEAVKERAQGEGEGSELFQLIGFHGKGSTHSSFANVEVLEAVAPRRLFINPLDAARCGLGASDRVVLRNERGAVLARIRITPRIMPGVLAYPQGAWYHSDDSDELLDRGGCVNTLTSATPTQLAHGNPHNSCLVELIRYADYEAKGGQ